MSQPLPPVTVQIKRKRTDEPVDFLRVHEANGKRQRRATDFVFSRQQTPDTGSDAATDQPNLQGPRKIKQLPRNTCTQHGLPASQTLPQIVAAKGGAEQQSRGTSGITTPITTSPIPSTIDIDAQKPVKSSQPRRFHISRSATPTSALDRVRGGQVQKRNIKSQSSVVFVERRLRPTSSDGSSPLSQTGLTGLGPALDALEPVRRQKKPGTNARSPVPRSRDPSPAKVLPTRAPAPAAQNVRLPSGLLMPWDVSSEQLAAEMQAYTLQEIGYNIAQSDANKPGRKPDPVISPNKPKTSKFKPKAPAMRYLERHPEERKPENLMDVDESYLEEDTDEDGDYIIDTYIRIPVEALDDSEIQKNIGLLILDSQPDIDEFYREDEDSEEEEDDVDEDENAENHYTADYPDEEVDSDDEYGRNAYNYRTHNASDLEEFDEDDARFSDDETDATKYPWAAKPWSKRPPVDDSDEDL